MDTEEVDPGDILGEFSLEDTYDHLQEVHKELQCLLEQLMNVASNNNVGILLSSTTPESIESKQCVFLRSLIKNSSDLNIKAEPMNNTSDLYEQLIQELYDEIKRAESLETTFKEDVRTIKNEINYLKNEKNCLQWMKEACIGANEDGANSTYDTEITLATRMFAQVKEDLGKLVAATTMNNENFQNVLADLTSSHIKGGNEVYIDVDPQSVDCVHFLIDADIAVYHRNDNHKVRLMDLI
ncbi:uncharacterized protein [Fopius arisanus]|uniref:Uncharacterized protein n=2 Tax=Fopius arisanus TaxID=64838 RepID=A0A9R1T8G6_9HYME|nr:PREDICTED: uncharacterized protein LOC105267894 [Fopius arisanus]